MTEEEILAEEADVSNACCCSLDCASVYVSCSLLDGSDMRIWLNEASSLAVLMVWSGILDSINARSKLVTVFAFFPRDLLGGFRKSSKIGIRIRNRLCPFPD